MSDSRWLWRRQSQASSYGLYDRGTGRQIGQATRASRGCWDCWALILHVTPAAQVMWVRPCGHSQTRSGCASLIAARRTGRATSLIDAWNAAHPIPKGWRLTFDPFRSGWRKTGTGAPR